MQGGSDIDISDKENEWGRRKEVEHRLKEEGKLKVQSGDWISSPKKGRGLTSVVWAKFGEVRDRQTMKYMNLVQCNNCKVLKIFKPGSATSPLLTHRCDPSVVQTIKKTVLVTSEMKEKFKDTCVAMCTGDIRPFSTFAGPNFTGLIQTAIDLGAQYGTFDAANLISTPTTLSRAVKKQAESARKEIFPEIREAAKLGLCSATTDLWSESYKQHHYITLTVHWIDQDFNLNNTVIFTRPFPSDEATSAVNLKKNLLSHFGEHGIPCEKMIFVTDGASNIKKALELLGVKRLYCVDHLINVILKSTFTLKLVDLDLYGASGNRTFEGLSRAVSCLRAKGMGKDLLKKIEDPPSFNGQATTGRFRSRIPFLESVLDNFQELFKLSVQEDLDTTTFDKEDLEDLIRLIKPIECAAKDKCNSLENVDYSWLQKHIESTDGDRPFILQTKVHIRQELASLDTIRLISKCKLIVSLFKRWGVMDQLQVSLKQEINVRWNSNLIMLLSFPRNFLVINTILISRNHQQLLISDEDQAQIQSLIRFLKAFKEESVKMEAEQKPTLHFVLLAFQRLKDHCNEDSEDTQAMAKLRGRAKKLLNTKFIPHELHKVATFLWPDFKHLSMLGLEERVKVQSAVREMMKEIKDSAPTSPPSKSPRLCIGDGYDRWRCVADYDEEDELDDYLAAKTGTCCSDGLLNWWKAKADRFPQLSKVARTVLGIPATSAASERAFSLAGNVITSRRSNLDPDNVDDIIFLNRYMKIRRRRQEEYL